MSVLDISYLIEGNRVKVFFILSCSNFLFVKVILVNKYTIYHKGFLHMLWIYYFPGIQINPYKEVCL